MRTLIVLAACLLLAACGSEETARDTQPATPQRVVALDHPSADDAIALGVVPIAMAKVDYVEGGIQDWTREALNGREVELLDVAEGIPVEKIAALRPDLILATNTYGLADSYDELERIAPVVGSPEDAGVATWQESAVEIGRALGREEQARALVAEVEGEVTAAREASPAFAGSTISFFNFWQGQPWVINSEADFSIRFLADLGFRLPPAVAELKGEEGRAAVSAERLDVLEADVIMGTTPAPRELERFARGDLFGRLDAVRRGAWVQLGIGPATAMAFPSLLSVRYGVREIVPQLAEALR